MLAVLLSWQILNLNERLLQLMTNQSGGSLGEVEAKEEGKSSSSNDTTRLVSAILDLQNAVNCLMDSSKDPSPLGQRNTPAGIRQILERKEGLFRMNMMGKRVNHACRSVISPDPYVGTNEIGIPLRFAMAFSYPEPVTAWNANELRKMVERGPTAYPGKALEAMDLVAFVCVACMVCFFPDDDFVHAPL